jgi:hypothetical protein
VKHYVVRRTPGTTLRAAVTARPAKRSGTAATSDELTLTLLTPAGDDECTYAHEAAFEWNATRDFLNASVFLDRLANSSHRITVPPQCHTADRLVLRVERDERSGTGNAADDPVELEVIEEPAADRVAALPGPADEADPTVLPPADPRGAAVGGGGFHDAVELTPGTGSWRTRRPRPGWASAPAMPGSSCAPTAPTVLLSHCPAAAASPPARRGASRMSRSWPRHCPNDGNRYDDPLQITIGVAGERRGAPAYRGIDPAESSAVAGQGQAAAPPDRLGTVVAVVAGGAALVLLATGLATVHLIRARRRRC